MPSHWIKPVTTTSTPRVLVALAYDPLDARVSPSGYVTTAGAWSVTTTRRRGPKWECVRIATVVCADAAAAWSAVVSAGASGCRVYVVTTGASCALTLLGLWSRVETGEVSLRMRDGTWTDEGGKKRRRRPHPLIMGDGVDVIGWEMGGVEYRAVSLSNHLAVPLVDAARWAGHAAPPDVYTLRRPTGHTHPDSSWSVGALTAIYHRLFAFWGESGAGRWADTIGAAAWSWWRTTCGERSVLEHDVEAARAIESAAVYGGRAQLFWFGSAGGGPVSPAESASLRPAVDVHLGAKVFKLDVRSMYASILAGEHFPMRLLHRLRCRSPERLASALSDVCVLATVRVRGESPRLPYRAESGRVCYPVGEWWTTLAGPELVAASERGEVAEVGECWAYERGRPFRAFADDLLSRRDQCRAAGDAVGGTYVKVLANALGGRLARLARGWVTDPAGICRERWGQWSEVTRPASGMRGRGRSGGRAAAGSGVGDAPTVTRCRGIAGVRQSWVDRGDRPGGLTACYAYLTAYGRVRLASIMDRCGPGTVIWCDTDGILVTERGLTALRASGERLDGSAGSLRIESEVHRFSARTPKMYCADGSWTLAGTRGDYSAESNGRIRHYQTAVPVSAGLDPAVHPVLTIGRTYRLDSIPLSGTPGRDGWLIPPVVRDGQLIQPTDELPDELRDWDYS